MALDDNHFEQAPPGSGDRAAAFFGDGLDQMLGDELIGNNADDPALAGAGRDREVDLFPGDVHGAAQGKAGS